MVQPKDNSKKLKLLGDYASQPSRAIFIFCLLNNIPHEIKLINVIKLEQYDEEFKKINPNAKVPAIVDGDVNLFESHTILRYLH
jgi:glutathione S-transferase